MPEKDNEMTNNIIHTDSPLADQQLKTLMLIVDLIIPGDEKRNMPAASDTGINSYLTAMGSAQLQALTFALTSLESSFVDAGLVIDTLSASEKKAQIEHFSSEQVELWQLLVMMTYTCYYQDEDVVKALGLNPLPPFPRGNEVKQGDLSLLDPVRNRTGLYRDC
jgi:hypothetical protein